ncbi:hypothetical protein SVEN_5856 [Streptomyces venezuelae ATCC 10712]|uniref:eCIS core domain-containing protein n=2 Tax=Streptomyces TaxID=1883 RepID=F2RAS3_STRVP|nr:hypothetical protein SVEN_5856 [Streptomyces venezuelae ATCC 10712]
MHAKANDRNGSTGERERSPGRDSTSRQPRSPGPAGPAARGMSPRQAGELQRRIGNAAVSRLVQRERQEPSGGQTAHEHPSTVQASHEHPSGGHAAHERPSGGQAAHEPPSAVQRSTVHQVLRGSGRPLGEALKSEMEGRLGADFSDVRLHTGPAAQRSAAEIGARAYTSGSHVVIGTGGADKHTLAHELTHVIQQRSGPVSGTDNGAGLSLSDPSDRFEREAEANAARVMARRPAGGQPSPAAAARPAAGAPVQRMLGFETEVSLPVADAAGRQYAGDTDLAQSTTEDFKIVSDKRALNNGAGYSNLEFVTGAVKVVGSEAATGPGTLDRLLDEIRTVSEAFYAATDGTRLQDMTLDLEVLPAGADARLRPGFAYPEYAGRPGMGDGLFVHYSVGVPLGGMPLFFDHLRDAAPVAPGAPNLRARFRLTQAKDFAAEVVAGYTKANEGSKKRKRLETDALDGYAQLFYTQIAAVADYLAQDADIGQIKNLTAVLSRSRLSDVRALLDPEFQTYLADNSDTILNTLADYQEKSETAGAPPLDFRENSTRNIDGNVVSLISYYESALTGTPAVDQQSVFGGMNQIAPHKEGGAMMVPFEIRTMGSLMKTWDELRAELHDLANWAEQSYRHDRSQTNTTNRPRTTGP